MADIVRAALTTKLHQMSVNIKSVDQKIPLDDINTVLFRTAYEQYYIPPNGETKEPSVNIDEFYVKLHPTYNKTGYWIRLKNGKEYTMSLKNFTYGATNKNSPHTNLLYKCLSGIRYSKKFVNFLSNLDQQDVKYDLRPVNLVYYKLSTDLTTQNTSFTYDDDHNVYKIADPEIQQKLEDLHMKHSIMYHNF